MINPSVFLRRAILADAVFSGVSAVLLTFGAGALAPWLNLPEALLRETGLFLIAYAALVGAGGNRDRRQRGVDYRQHRASVQRRGHAQPARRSRRRDPGHCGRRLCRTAIYRATQERRRAGGLSKISVEIVIASQRVARMRAR